MNLNEIYEQAEQEAYFVDNFGVVELQDFFGPAQKKPAQM